MKDPAKLAGLEREVRRRFELNDAADDQWFLNVAHALSTESDVSSAYQRAEILLVISRWASKSAGMVDQLSIGAAALRLSVEARAPALQRKAWNNLGRVQLEMRDYSEAFVCFARALEIAETLGDRIGMCAVLANLAAARLEAGLIDESIKLNTYVVDLGVGEIHLRSVVLQAHHNIAVAALYLGDLNDATSHMNAALPLLSEPEDGFVGLNRVIVESTFTRIRIRTGDLDGARERMRLAAGYAQMVNSRPAYQLAELAQALCEAGSGDSEAAFVRLDRLESEIGVGDIPYRDFLEVKLLCNRLAGKDHYDRYYNRKYLSSLSRFQRSQANAQIKRIKTSLSLGTQVDLRTQLEALTILAELREEPTGEHSIRVGKIARALALAAGYSDARAGELETASRLHDIGKLAVPDAVLCKRDKLTRPETEIVRRHAIEGCQMLSDVLTAAESGRRSRGADVDVLRLAAEIALHHHEWWDGSGYPRKVLGPAIPEAARITALADAFDELTHPRPYKPACSIEAALEQIRASGGKQFDPRLASLLPDAVQALSESDISGFARGGDETLPFVSANRVIMRLLAQSAAPSVRPGLTASQPPSFVTS